MGVAPLNSDLLQTMTLAMLLFFRRTYSSQAMLKLMFGLLPPYSGNLKISSTPFYLVATGLQTIKFLFSRENSNYGTVQDC
jgi:hypothetical protein